MTPTPAAPSGELLPLPEPDFVCDDQNCGEGAYTADRMREYYTQGYTFGHAAGYASCERRAAVSQAAPEQAIPPVEPVLWYNREETPEFIDNLYAVNPAAILDLIALARRATASPCRIENIEAICDAYESGVGHGLQRDGHSSGAMFSNPASGKAYEIGYTEGECRVPTSKSEVEELRAQLAAMRAAFHGTMLRVRPHQSHDEITAEIDRAIGPSKSEAAPRVAHSFTRPDGWINLAKPEQSWEEWTKEQGPPTTKGWAIAANTKQGTP